MSEPVRPSARLGLSLTLSAALAACSSFSVPSLSINDIVSPHKIDVVQGNFVSSEQVALLKPGMGRQAVRDVLGTSLLMSVFHAERWDYVFTFKRKGEEMQLRKVTIFFKNGTMERFEADALPSEAEFVAALDSGRRFGSIPLLEASEESLSLFPPPAKAPEAVALPPLPSSYPPLESTEP
jgi:outer membrane protein assembly factor BamE